MPANSSYSPTMVEKKSSLDIMSNIADNVRAIAKDLAEYVEIKTGKASSPSSPSLDTSSKSLSPTPKIDFVSGESKKPAEKKKGFFAKMFKMFSPGNIMKALMGLAIIGAIVGVMYLQFKEAFTTFFSNIWESIKEGLDKIGEWFGNLFDAAGELLSGLGESISDFLAPLISKFTSFVSGITDWFSDKFTAIKEFLGLSKAPAPGGGPDKANNNNTVDNKNVPAHMRSAKKEVPKKEFVPLSKQTTPNPEGAKRLLDNRAETIRIRNEKIAAGITDPKELYKRRKPTKRKKGKSPSSVTNERPVIDGEASSTIPTPTSSSGGMDDVKAMVMQHEGVRYEPYKDTKGLWTIGVGHLIGDGKSLPEEWDRKFSEEEISNLFDEDFSHHKKIAERTPGYGKANESGKAAFIDLAFNMGKWWPKWPNTSDALSQGNFSLAANELQDSAWYGQVGSRADTVVGLVASAGSSQGSTLASNSNDNSVQKRGMGSGGEQTIVNSGTVNNNTVVKNEVVVASKQENTGMLANRIS
jgi:lysozyme